MKYRYANAHLVERFEAWWRGENRGLPLMRVIGFKDTKEPRPVPQSNFDRFANLDFLLAQKRWDDAQLEYLGDAYSSADVTFGPDALAMYLGAEPVFAQDTVWRKPCVTDPENMPPVTFDPNNKWFVLQTQLLRKMREAAGDDFRVNMQSMSSGIDTYSAMRGPQDFLFDLMDYPDEVKAFIRQIEKTYFPYFDLMNDAVRDEDGITSYLAFHVLGKGRLAVIPCDCIAMISPAHFREFVLPSLRWQIEGLDHALYHLDGPDAIRHVPALMEIEKLQAVQWTYGAGNPDGADPRWYTIYDQVTAAKKSLWISFEDGGVDDWIRGAETLLNRYEKGRLYFIFPRMPMADAEKLMNHAVRHWESD